MADIKFTPKARNANAVSGESFENGSMIVATDTGELYVDYNGARMRIGDVITLETDAQRLATLAPLPKLYWVAETGKLWRFADDWVCVNPDDIEADTLSIGKSTFFNVASYTHNGNVYELLLKTAIYKGSGAANILIRVHGNCGDSIVDFTVHLYWFNNSYTYRAAVNNGSMQPTLKAFSYTTDKDYVGLAIIGLMYYPRLTVDMFDMWSINRNYDNNWIIEANTTSSTTSIIPTDDLAEVTWQPIYNDIVQAGRSYYNVATINHSGNVYEILIKTRIPVANQAWMPVVYIHGHTGRNMVDLALTFYYNSGLTWAAFTNKGTWAPTIKYFTYIDEDGEDYIGIALIGTSYYGKYQVDLSDIWNTTRNYSGGWTVEYNTSQDTTIVPTTNLVEAEQYRISTGIIGSASSLFTPRTIALTGGVTGTATAFDGSKNIQIPVTAVNPNNLSSAVPVTKGGTGATSAANARTALEAGYTIRRTITTTGTGWYRIAATIINVGRNYTDVFISASLAGRNSQIGLVAAIAQGYSGIEHTAVQLSQKAFVEQYNGGITKARIVYPNDNYTNKYAYLEIYQEYDASATLAIEFQNCSGWATRYDEPIAGEIPDGYSAKEITFVHNAVVADNFVGLLYPPDNAGINSLRTPTISEVACIPELLVDRLQFFPTNKCTAETSTDGTSWTTKTLSASQWNSLLCCNPSYPAGLTWNNGTQLRLTFTYNTYVALSMLYLYVATGSRLKVIIERYRNSTKDWVELASMGGIVGQPQHVTLWHDAILFTNTSNDSYSSQVRVTLIHEGNSTDTPRIDMLRWKGGYPAVNPNIYNWDPNKNVTFPMTVTAANFKGYWEWLLPAPSFNENSTSTIPTCKQVADYIKSLIGG